MADSVVAFLGALIITVNVLRSLGRFSWCLSQQLSCYIHFIDAEFVAILPQARQSDLQVPWLL